MINLKDIPSFKTAPMGMEFKAHHMYPDLTQEVLGDWELTGEFRFVSEEKDEAHLGWNEDGLAVIIGRTPLGCRIRAPRLILRRKAQPIPQPRQPRMAVTEIDVYGTSIPPIPEGWEDNGFCIIREELHEAYLDLNGEARDTKKYALVGMVRIALKRKPQPPTPLIGPDTKLGQCFRSDGAEGKPPRYYKVISNSLDGFRQRNYFVIEQMGEIMDAYKFTHGWGIYAAYLTDQYVNSQPYLSHVSDLVFKSEILRIIEGR